MEKERNIERLQKILKDDVEVNDGDCKLFVCCDCEKIMMEGEYCQ